MDAGNESEPMPKPDREQWGNQMEFFFTCIAYAVGLGNVWRFPYLAYKNGGGAFLIPYVIMLALVGLPLFFMEIALGQYSSLGPIKAWKVSPLFKGIGVASVFVSALIGLYYNVIVAYCLVYLISSMTSELPWSDCNNDWNSDVCISNSTGEENTTFYTPSEEYFYKKVLDISDGIDDPGGMQPVLVGSLAAAWFIVFLVLIKGVGSLGKVVYFVAIFPYIMLTILLVRGLTLEGASDGVMYYLSPSWERLADIQVWKDAAVQIFFSLSACTGGLITMSSYNRYENNIRRDAILIPLLNCATSVFAGFVIFSVLGFMAHEKNVPIDEVAEQGPGLVFVVYPEALSKMPVPPLWSILFFIMMCSLGFGSQFSIIENVIASIIDQFPGTLRSSTLRSICFRAVVCSAFFLVGLTMVTRGGMYVLNVIDESAGGLPLLFVGLFELIALHWVYGVDKFAENIYEMTNWRISIYWKMCWKYIAPTILLVIIILSCIEYAPITYSTPYADDGSGVYVYPRWSISIEWFIYCVPVVFVLIGFLHEFCKNGGLAALKDSSVARWDWGPAKEQKAFYAAEESTASFTSCPEDISLSLAIRPTSAPDPVDRLQDGTAVRPTPQGHDNNAFYIE